MFKKLASVVSNAFGWGVSEDYSSDENDSSTDALVASLMRQMSCDEVTQENFSITPPKPAKVLKSQHRVGKITRLCEVDGVIDDKYFFDRRDAPAEGLEVGKSVTYHAFRNSEEQEWRVTKIMQIHEEFWIDDEDDVPNLEVEAQPLEEDSFIQDVAINKRTIVGKVQLREGREVIVRDCKQVLKAGIFPRDTRFNLDNVASEFTPIKGDIVSMDSIVEISEETVDGSGDVIQVLSIKPFRARVDEGVVTKWCRQFGLVNNDIYFERDACDAGYVPRLKDEVKMEIIECERQGSNWRAISVKPLDLNQREEYPKSARQICYRIDPDLLKNKGNIIVQENTNFKSLPSSGNYRIEVSVTNEGTSPKTITKHYIDSEPSNLTLVSPKSKRVVIEPQDTIIFSFDYNKSLSGFSCETFVIEFGNMQIGRLIQWEVCHPEMPDFTSSVRDDKFYHKARHELAQKCAQNEEDRAMRVPAPRTVKTPSFVHFRIGSYEVPLPIKEAMTTGLDGSAVYKKDAAKILKEHYPELDQKLSSLNHYKRFHCLLYIAETDARIDMCRYAMERASFVRRGQASEYLALEIPGLAEGRPSLLINDSITIRSSWGSQGAKFQGTVCKVLANEVWLKFDAHFHSTYNSEDYDVTFDLSRGTFRKCHAALDICHKNQANLWLFPKGVRTKPPQVALKEDVGSPLPDTDLDVNINLINGHEESGKASLNGQNSVQNFFGSFQSSPQKSGTSANGDIRHVDDVEKSLLKVDGIPNQVVKSKGTIASPKGAKIAEIHNQRSKTLAWFNKRLNHRQKEAVRNVLQGEARPLPYVIFGPPGTGKTMTLVETILQIYTLIGDSRLLVATPSNSSANLIAERLLDTNLLQPGDMIRLVANHLVADGKIPPKLVPYSATINNDAQATDEIEQNSRGVVNLSRQLIMTRRITIGTCVALGQIITLGLPRGHYTHIVVDEAGQATEPEILIPLGFMAHESGQAILAGDPNQLGPVVQSHLAGDLGLSKSLLARLLPQFPYQRDPTGFPESGGYDPRLVTRLTVNYRSLPDILELPSSLFYDSDLEAWVSEEHSYESKLLTRATTHLNLPHSAVVFIGMKGCTMRDADSPSFFNMAEVVNVIAYVRQLLDAGIKREDIGIITPYKKQAMKIKQLIEKLSITDEEDTCENIKIGSVEEFQGQERMVIILSTVRSIGSGHIEMVGRFTSRQLLGFVNNPERLNVAISRARALLIICGDPEVLCIDTYWRSVVKYCKDRKSYIGTAVPKDLFEN